MEQVLVGEEVHGGLSFFGRGSSMRWVGGGLRFLVWNYVFTVYI